MITTEELMSKGFDLIGGINGCTVNAYEGYKLITEAAKLGNSDAQYYLGMSYWCGFILPKNTSEALKWFTLSSANGNIRSK